MPAVLANARLSPAYGVGQGLYALVRAAPKLPVGDETPPERCGVQPDSGDVSMVSSHEWRLRRHAATPISRDLPDSPRVQEPHRGPKPFIPMALHFTQWIPRANGSNSRSIPAPGDGGGSCGLCPLVWRRGDAPPGSRGTSISPSTRRGRGACSRGHAGMRQDHPASPWWGDCVRFSRAKWGCWGSPEGIEPGPAPCGLAAGLRSA